MPKSFRRTDDEIPTSILIRSFLKGSNRWQIRERAAELLRTRSERGVPDALLEACHDKSLDVIRTSLNSFKSITGFESTDVFGCDEAKQWWKENKSEKEKNLKAHEGIK
jgi:hypothetical protein